MMSLSDLDLTSPLGRVLKKLSDALLPKGMVAPIMKGPGRGMKWIVGSSNHSCLLGSYELPKRQAMQKHLKPGMTAYDLGAHVGYFTLLLSRLVGEQGAVYAFEPLAENCQVLRRHLQLNNVGNVVLQECAVSDTQGEVVFYQDPSSYEGSIVTHGVAEKAKAFFKVPTMALDDFVYSLGNRPPDFIKMDIEGAEYLACLGMERILKEHRPIMFIALHGPEVGKNCGSFLKTLQYKIVTLDHVPFDDYDHDLLEIIALPGHP
jgi:FkbM family methyltransferase